MRRRREKKKFTFGILSIIFALIYLPISFIILLNILLCFIAILSLIFSIISITREDLKFLGIIGLLLTIVSITIVIGFYCFGPETKKTATIDGKKYSYSDIKEVAESNKTKFEKKYEGKSIILKGTVKKIEEEYTKYVDLNKIIFQEGWILELPKNCNYKLEDLDNGDKITINSKISYYSFSDVYLADYSLGKEKVTCNTNIKKGNKEL